MATPKTTTQAQRVEQIRRAAIPVFAAQGFRGTSMADIAKAAGVSRPALYQYFDNRADVFRAALDAVMQDSADAALAALRAEGSTVERLDRYVQHAYGDGYEALSATPFGAELMDVRHQFAADVADAATARTRQGLRAFVGELSTVGATTRTELIDLLVLAPTGLKGDNPSPRIYRRRLRTLAAAAARLLDAGWPAANTREPAGIDDVDVVNTPHPENPR